MAVVNPIKVVLNNFDENSNEEIETSLFPDNKEAGSRKIHLTKVIYIERSDFKEEEDKEFFGLTPKQETGLKNAGIITCKNVKKNNEGEVIEIECDYRKDITKTKTRIHWISDNDAQKVEVRVYDYLFTVDKPSELEDPFTKLNEHSLVVRSGALINKNLLSELKEGAHFQFERLGYFVVDKDSDASLKRFVFNLTVGLDDKNKKI